MFNFCAVLAGHDMVTDACSATTCSCKINAPSLQEINTTKDLPKALVLSERKFSISDQKKE